MPEEALPTTGDEYLFLIDENPISTDDATPVFKNIGGQMDGNLDRKLGDVDTTTKDDENWETHIPTNRSWEASVDCLVELGDEGQEIIRAMFENRQTRKVQVVYPDDTKYIGRCTVTSFKEGAPQAGVVKASITLKGTGKLSKVTV